MKSEIQEIKYPDNQRIIDRMKEEISAAFGLNEWNRIT